MPHYPSPAKNPQPGSLFEFRFYGLALADRDFDIHEFMPPIPVTDAMSEASKAYLARTNPVRARFEAETVMAYLDQLRSAGVPKKHLRPPYSVEIQALIHQHICGQRSILLDLYGPVARPPENRDPLNDTGYRRELTVRSLIGTQFLLETKSPDDVVRNLLAGLTRDSVDQAWRTLRRWLKSDPGLWRLRLARDTITLRSLDAIRSWAQKKPDLRQLSGAALVDALQERQGLVEMIHRVRHFGPEALTQFGPSPRALNRVRVGASVTPTGSTADARTHDLQS